MKIGSIYSYQSFKSNNSLNNSNNCSFMGDVAEFVDSTADLMKAAKSAIDSPEEASVRVLTNQIDNVAKNEKTPGWVKKGLKYASAGLTASLMGVAAYKTPGGIKNIAKRLEKFKIASPFAKFYQTSRAIIYKNMGKLGNIDFIKSAKNKAEEVMSTVKNFLVKKFPRPTEMLKNTYNKLHMENLTKTKAAKALLGLMVGVSSGKRVLNKYEKLENKSIQLNEDDIEISEAA